MPNALIWGASGGMGQALVKALKEKEWTVFAAARDVANVPEVADDEFEFEASSQHSIQQTMMFVAQQVEELDLIVYTAGSLAYEKLDHMDFEGWMQTMDSNLNGAFLAAHYGLPLLRKGGHMVFIGVYADHIRLPKMGAYAVAKAGLDELVRILAKENRRQNFTIVRPGAVQSAFWEQVSFRMPDDAKDPQIVAQAIIELYESNGAGVLEL